MGELVAWLRAQLDWSTKDASEDHTLGCSVHDVEDNESVFEDPRHCDCPVRFRLIDAQSKRAILDEFVFVVKLLALPYADRPGYLEEWRP